MASFDYEALGQKAKELGFAGVDLTVREKGHVLPERAAQDLPRAVQAIRAQGLAVPMVTTNILSATDPVSRQILATAAQQKVAYWKPGYLRYKTEAVDAALENAREAVRGFATASREYGIQAGFHNHSGDYIGSAVWDTRELIKDLDPKWIGYYFDPAHSRIEGGLMGWKLTQTLVSQRLKMVALKDFFWRKEGSGWKLIWCPMGEGMVDWPKVFAGLAEARFAGPLTLHLEYEPKDELEAIARDVAFVKKHLQAAYS